MIWLNWMKKGGAMMWLSWWNTMQESRSHRHLYGILHQKRQCVARRGGRAAAAATSHGTPAGSQFSPRPLINAAVHRRHLTSPFSSLSLLRYIRTQHRGEACGTSASAIVATPTPSQLRCSSEEKKRTLRPKMASQLNPERTRCTIVSYLLPPPISNTPTSIWQKRRKEKGGNLLPVIRGEPPPQCRDYLVESPLNGQ